MGLPQAFSRGSTRWALPIKKSPPLQNSSPTRSDNFLAVAQFMNPTHICPILGGLGNGWMLYTKTLTVQFSLHLANANNITTISHAIIHSHPICLTTTDGNSKSQANWTLSKGQVARDTHLTLAVDFHFHWSLNKMHIHHMEGRNDEGGRHQKAIHRQQLKEKEATTKGNITSHWEKKNGSVKRRNVADLQLQRN